MAYLICMLFCHKTARCHVLLAQDKRVHTLYMTLYVHFLVIKILFYSFRLYENAFWVANENKLALV